MTAAAWIFMLISVSFVTALVSWCFYRVLTAPEKPAHEFEEFHSA